MLHTVLAHGEVLRGRYGGWLLSLRLAAGWRCVRLSVTTARRSKQVQQTSTKEDAKLQRIAFARGANTKIKT